MLRKSIVKAFLFALALFGVDHAFAQGPAFTYPPGAHNYTTGTPIAPLSPNSTGGPVPPGIFGQVTTFVGDGQEGFADGQGTAASLSSPVGIAFDPAGNLYITDYYLLHLDYYNNMIRKVTPGGLVTTLAGNTNTQSYVEGQGATAGFFSPNGVAVDASGNVYVADVGNNVIRKITPGGLVSTYAGSGARGALDNDDPTKATFNAPSGLVIDGIGNLYVSDYSNNLIRKITPAGKVTTLAGSGAGTLADGNGTAASFRNPEGLAIDFNGNLYVADVGNNAIRKVTLGGQVTTFAGSVTAGSADNPVALLATFRRPTGVAVDIGGNVYVADAANNKIRRISTSGAVTTVAGSGALGNANGIGAAATFDDPEGIAIDAVGNLYVGDKGNNLVRKINVTGYTISPNLPPGLNFDGTSGIISGTPTSPSGTATYTVAGYNVYGSATATVTISVTGAVITQVPPPAITYVSPQIYKVNLTIPPLAPTNSGGPVPATSYGNVSIFAGSGIPGAANGTGALATFNNPDGVAVDPSGNIFVADKVNKVVRKITPAGVVTTFATGFNQPAGIATNATGTVFLSDAANNTVYRITAGGVVSILASGFNNPHGLVVDASGNVFVADESNNVIKKITPGGLVTVFAGTGALGSNDGLGTAASFSRPAGIAIDAAGYLYITDSGNQKIRKITPGGLVTTLAGSGAQGSADGVGAAATFQFPSGIAIDGIGNLYIADSGSDIIRKVTPNGTVTTLAGLANQIGRANGIGAVARFNEPQGVAIDKNGNLFIGDLVNNLIREISITGYSISAPLPPGLTFDTKTGIISGTPTAPSPATNYTITAYNLGGSSSYIVNITVQNPVIVVVPPPNISYVTPQNYVVNTPIIPLGPANIGGAVPQTIYGQVSTFAGTGASGSANGAGTSSTFSGLFSVATDLVGNVYVTDNNLVRKISPTGVSTPMAGSGAAGSADGQGAAASFNQPLGIAVDGTGTIYVADSKNNTIRMVTQGGQVTIFAGTNGAAGLTNGTGTAAKFNNPWGIAVDQNGNIYVADEGNNVIRKITPAGLVSTFAGSGAAGSANGTGTGASFNKPTGVSVDLNGNVYVADQGNNLIRKITPAGVVTTLAGSGSAGSANGQGTAASFNTPVSISADVSGTIYVGDENNNLIRKITPAGLVTTLAGSGAAGSVDGQLTTASFNKPDGVSADIFGNVYVADLNNNKVRKIVTTGYTISPGGLPPGLTFDGKTGIISGKPTAIWPTTIYTVTAYNIGGSSSTQISITVSDKQIPPVPPPNITYTPQKDVYVVNTTIPPLVPVNTGGILPNKPFGKTTTLAGSGSPGSNNGNGTAATFNQPFGVATDTKGNIYVVDHLNNLIRKITRDGTVTTLAGSGAIGSADGIGTAASFNQPTGIAVDVAGNVYVADVSNNKIRKISPTGVVTTLAGSGALGSTDGTGTDATFNNPSGLAVDGAGNIYVADLGNNKIRKITPGGVVTTVAGTGISGTQDGPVGIAMFNQPYGVAVDPSGNIYVADWANNLIREITTSGVVKTIAGDGKAGFADGQGTAASFNRPFGLTLDENGNIYVADTGNEKIRKITPGGFVTTVAGSGERGADNGDTGPTTTFYQPVGIVTDGGGNVYIADEFNHMIRQVVVVSNYTIDKPLPPGLLFDAGTGIISGTPTAPSPATDYTITAYNDGGSSSYIVNITVLALAQTITFSQPVIKTYGDVDFDPGATSNNTTIPITYTSSDPTVATIAANGEIHITGAGTSTLTASQAGNVAYIAADPKTQQLTVKQALLTIVADDKSRIFETPNPPLTIKSFEGFVYGEDVNALLTPPVLTTSADLESPVGDYSIDIIGATSNNYDIHTVSGILSITPAPDKIIIPNTFTPNGDGINDLWNITALNEYPACTVDIYTRYGKLIFQSKGYGNAWDGTYDGSQLPVGTYYYIINTHTGLKQMAGCVTIIR